MKYSICAVLLRINGVLENRGRKSNHRDFPRGDTRIETNGWMSGVLCTGLKSPESNRGIAGNGH